MLAEKRYVRHPLLKEKAIEDRLYQNRILRCTLLIWVCFLIFVTSTNPSESKENLPRETIRIAMFINYHPAYGSWVSKIIAMEIEDVEGLPINYSTFTDDFLKASILWVSYGMDGWAIRVVLRCDLSMDNETANKYASMISDNVLKLMNKSSLPTYWRNTRIDNATNTLVVTIDRGLLPRTFSSLEGLLKYRPKDGFASLLTDELLRKFVPGEIHEEGPLLELGMSQLKYTLQRTNNRYSWNFLISFSIRTTLGEECWFETLDLNSFFLSDGPIKPSKQRTSEIIIEMPKKHEIPAGTYEMSFKSVYPPQDIEKEDDWIRVSYQLTTPVDNVIATVKVSKIKSSSKWDKVIFTVLVIIALAILVTLFLKKRGRR